MTDNDVTKLLIALRAADEMARICDDWVKRGIIDSRSALADARLNYGQPFEYEWSKPTEQRPPTIFEHQPEEYR